MQMLMKILGRAGNERGRREGERGREERVEQWPQSCCHNQYHHCQYLLPDNHHITAAEKKYFLLKQHQNLCFPDHRTTTIFSRCGITCTQSIYFQIIIICLWIVQQLHTDNNNNYGERTRWLLR